MQVQGAQPKSGDLFLASLVATALVYLLGILVIALLVAVTSSEDALKNAVTFLGFFATLGMGAAMVTAVLIVAPLGTALGKLMLRLTPAGWWQGPPPVPLLHQDVVVTSWG